MKIKKLSTKITIFIVIATVIGMAILSILASLSIMKIMKTEAINELEGKVGSTSSQIERYIEKQNAYVDGFLASPVMKELAANDFDEASLEAAEQWSKQYNEEVSSLLSVFYVSAGGKIILDSKDVKIGFQNPQATVDFLTNMYANTNGVPVYSLTIVPDGLTLGEGSIVLIANRSFYRGTEYVGHADIEIDRTELYNLLDSTDLAENQEVVLTGVSNPIVYYSNNRDEVTIESENPAIKEALSRATAENPETTGAINYVQPGTGKAMLGYFMYLPERDWLLFIGADAGELYDSANDAALSIIIMGLILAIVITVVLSLIIKAAIKPITKVEKAISKVAAHDITANTDLDRLTKRSDEIGKLAVCTKEVIKTLNDAVGLFKNCSGSLNDSSKDLDKASKLLSDVTGENRFIADNLSVKINETNDSIESIHNEIDNIANLVNVVSEKVAVGENDSQKLIDSASQINEKIDMELETNMATLQHTMVNMQEALESLNAVEQINALAEDIMSITSQTNLLSLNASIEAARAGEAGKGFAVVAGEIGQLADQSKETAMNITEIVSASNKSVTDVRDQVTKLIEYIKNDIMSSFDVFATQIKQYDEGIFGIKSAVTEIGGVMDSLSASIEEIARRITSVNDASLDNTEGVTNILRKNLQTTDVSSDIERLAETSRENAESLKGAINQFKVD